MYQSEIDKDYNSIKVFDQIYIYTYMLAIADQRARPNWRNFFRNPMDTLGWCIFRPTHIRHTPLLTYAKSADP